MAINWLQIVETAGDMVTNLTSEEMQEFTEELFGYGNTMIDLCKDLGAEAMLFATVVGKMVNLTVSNEAPEPGTRGIKLTPKLDALASRGIQHMSA